MRKRTLPTGTGQDLAEMLDLDPSTVSKLVKNGVITRPSDGRFVLPKAIEEYYRDKYCTDEQLDYAEEKAKHEKVKRELSELELARRKGLVHASEDVEMVMTDMLSNLRAQLLALPSKLAPMLADRGRDYIYGLLESEIKDRLTELSDYSPELFTDVETSTDDDASQEDD